MARAAAFQNLVTLVIVIAGVVLLIGAGRSGVERNLEPWFADGLHGVAAVMVMVPLMFVGFDVVPQAAAEIDLAPRTIGRMMLVAVLCAIVWYAGVILAVGYVFDAAARSASALATADAARVAWSSAWAGHLLVVGGIAGILTSWNAFLVGASRLMHALALAGMAPAWLLGGRSSANVPVRSLWIICALSCLAPWFGRPALVWLLNAGSLAIVIAYALVALAFVRLRTSQPHMPRPYRVPGSTTVGWIAFALSLALGALYLPWSPSALTLPEWVVCGAWLVAGCLVYRNAPARHANAYRRALP
jgi:amino acid transporter